MSVDYGSSHHGFKNVAKRGAMDKTKVSRKWFPDQDVASWITLEQIRDTSPFRVSLKIYRKVSTYHIVSLFCLAKQIMKDETIKKVIAILSV